MCGFFLRCVFRSEKTDRVEKKHRFKEKTEKQAIILFPVIAIQSLILGFTVVLPVSVALFGVKGNLCHSEEYSFRKNVFRAP